MNDTPEWKEPTANDVIATIHSFIDSWKPIPTKMILPACAFRYNAKHTTRRKRKKFHENWARLLKRPMREMRMVAMGRAVLC